MERTFLVRTDHGDVVVRLDEAKSGLDPDLFVLEAPTPANTAELRTAVPLRAFGAKVIELIESRGGDIPGGERLRRLLLQEKAGEDLNRIERWARERAGR